MNNFIADKIYFFDLELVGRKIYSNSLEYAYLLLLNDNLANAEEIFKLNDSPRGHWGSALISILNGYIVNYPTYFQIRNFLEIDLDFLIKNEKIDYVESLLGALEYLVNINQEVYKYSARVLFANKLDRLALDYLMKSKEIYYNDPELHFMLASYNFKKLKMSSAYESVKECLKIIPDYYPALVLKTKIEEKFI